MLKSFKQSPTFHFLTKTTTNNKPLKVSIIIAARNEEKYIEKCLDSLLKQDYPNFEIIAVDDSSSDKTFEIMQDYQLLNPDKMTVINAGLASDEWVGKNWACYQGYLNSTGEIFLFTDADTVCSPCTLSIAIEHLSKDKLDGLTVRPNILCKSLWSKIIFPVILTFSHVKYSALRVNNDKSKKHGYFFGCFYLITRKTYESIGTHNEVKNEIIEDVALGKKVKQRGYKIRMYRGEHHINTVAAGSFGTILQGIRRSINLIPFFSNDTINTFLTWFLLVKPFFVFLYSALLLNNNFNDCDSIQNWYLPKSSVWLCVTIGRFTYVIRLCPLIDQPTKYRYL
jgi:chlorobactene glucosyltransferase